MSCSFGLDHLPYFGFGHLGAASHDNLACICSPLAAINHFALGITQGEQHERCGRKWLRRTVALDDREPLVVTRLKPSEIAFDSTSRLQMLLTRYASSAGLPDRVRISRAHG